MDRDKYKFQDESMFIDINRIKLPKRLQEKAKISIIKQTNYESILKNFEEKFLKLFSENNENLKMLKLTIEEDALDFVEISIPIEAINQPTFKNFKSLTEMFKKFFMPESKKNFFQLFLNAIDLLNFFCKDLFSKHKFNYFGSDKHLVQPKIKEFIQQKLLEKDIAKEISVFYSLTEKINFGFSEEFLLY